jgi:hypothetical protein
VSQDCNLQQEEVGFSLCDIGWPTAKGKHDCHDEELNWGENTLRKRADAKHLVKLGSVRLRQASGDGCDSEGDHLEIFLAELQDWRRAASKAQSQTKIYL